MLPCQNQRKSSEPPQPTLNQTCTKSTQKEKKKKKKKETRPPPLSSDQHPRSRNSSPPLCLRTRGSSTFSPSAQRQALLIHHPFARPTPSSSRSALSLSFRLTSTPSSIRTRAHARMTSPRYANLPT